MLEERSLHRVERLAVPRPSIVVIFSTLRRHGKRQAGIHTAAIQQHRTGTALAVVAALLASGKVQLLPQQIQQAGPGIKRELMAVAFVDWRGLTGRCCRLCGRCAAARFARSR